MASTTHTDRNKTGDALHQPQTLLVQGWQRWWLARDQWIAKTVKAALLTVYVLGFLMFFTSHGSGGPGGVSYQIGSPTPWYELQYHPNQGHHVELRLSLAWLGLAVAFAAYYAYWRIRGVEPIPLGRFSSPRAQFVIWSIAAGALMAWGCVALAINQFAR